MNKNKSVLIVDDEKNIRLTLSQSLEMLALETDTAINGEEALEKLKDKNFDLILLDLKMPGMDGMDVLRRVQQIRPDIRIIIITAHGTIESAVEAMKLGAVDFLQKPFAPNQIRDLVSRVVDREKLDAQQITDYTSFFELAKRCMMDRNFSAAMEHARKAIAIDPFRPEAFNLLGILFEIHGDRLQAQKNYRAALSLDPTFQPAINNLSRSTGFNPQQGIILGEAVKEEKNEEI